MIIHRMQASFGCLDGQSLELYEGMNLISAPNESGKSTWCAFLVAMLYGINTRTRDKKAQLSEKTRFRPWSGAPLEGLVECDYLGKRVILRRGSEGGQAFDSFSAVWAETGQAVPALTGESAGLLLTGVGREVFERSLLFRQGSLSVEQSQELEQRITALLSSGEEETSWSRADGRLREWQRRRRHFKTGELPQLEEEERVLAQRSADLQSLWAEHAAAAADLEEAEQRAARQRASEAAAQQAQRSDLEGRWAEAAAALDTAQLKLQSIEEAAAQAQSPQKTHAQEEEEKDELEGRIRRRGTRLILVSAVGLLLCLLLFLPALRERLTLGTSYGLISALGLMVLGANLVRLRKDKQDRDLLDNLSAQRNRQQSTWMEEEREKNAAREAEYTARQHYVALTHELENSSRPSAERIAAEESIVEKRQILARLSGRLEGLGDPDSLAQERATLQARHSKLQAEYDALGLAIALLEHADESLRAGFSPALNARASLYFSRLTDGAYENVLFARDFSAQTETVGSPALRNALLLSHGTLDQLYFALRLAICALILPQENQLPLVLDDALGSFDDTRAARALTLLCELSETRQILFFTCQSREETLLENFPAVHHCSPHLLR